MSTRAERVVFTDPYIRALKPQGKPYKRAESAPKGQGRLMVRVLTDGTAQRPEGVFLPLQGERPR